MKRERIDNQTFVSGSVECEYGENDDGTVSLCLYDPTNGEAWIEYTARDYLV